MNYLQKIYSDAFDEGFEFFAQKEFGLGNRLAKFLGYVKESELEDVKNKALEEKAEIGKKLNEVIEKSVENQEQLKKSLKRWKIGAGVTAGVAGLGGLGAYLYNRKKKED